MRRKTGIYKIVNVVTGKCYVGSAVNIKGRWSVHKSTLMNNKHHSSKLQRSYNKHGLEHFIFEVLEVCDGGVLIEREQCWIDKLDSYHKGYNNTLKAGSRLGTKHTEKTKHMIGLKSKGRYHSDETKKKISTTLNGLMVGEKNPMWGRTHTDEVKGWLSEINSGKNNPYYGKKHTNDIKKDISVKLKKLYKNKRKHPSYNPKSINQYTLNGVLVKTWLDMIEISDGGSFDKKAVSKVCRGLSKTHGGYMWSYL